MWITFDQGSAFVENQVVSWSVGSELFVAKKSGGTSAVIGHSEVAGVEISVSIAESVVSDQRSSDFVFSFVGWVQSGGVFVAHSAVFAGNGIGSESVE